MAKQELLQIMRVLSAMESAMFVAKVQIPEYLLDQLLDCVQKIEAEILKD